MKHIIFFTYVATIPVIIIAMVLLILLRKNNNNSIKQLPNLEFFIGILLISLVSDMLLYYNDILFNGSSKDIFYELGFMLCNGGVLCWFNTIKGIYKNKISAIISKVSGYYFVAYATAWIAIITSEGNSYDSIVMKVLDIVFAALILAEMCSGLSAGIRKQCENRKNLVFSELVSLMMLVVSFIYTLGIYDWYYSDYTVVFWLMMGILTCLIEVDYLKNKSSKVRREEAAMSSEEAIQRLGNANGFTSRETEILTEVYLGRNNLEIAEKFVISESTVKTHMHNMLKKVGARNRVEIICMVQDAMNGKNDNLIE